MIISSISCDSFKMRRLEEQRQVSTAAAIEKIGMADTMVGQKSGPALAGPAAAATTALDHNNHSCLLISGECLLDHWSSDSFSCTCLTAVPVSLL